MLPRLTTIPNLRSTKAASPLSQASRQQARGPPARRLHVRFLTRALARPRSPPRRGRRPERTSQLESSFEFPR